LLTAPVWNSLPELQQSRVVAEIFNISGCPAAGITRRGSLAFSILAFILL